MTAPTMAAVIQATALAVPCPSCRAARGHRCRPVGAWRRFGAHPDRVGRGQALQSISAGAQHERALTALSRVRAAGRWARQQDVTTALACCCPPCIADTERFGRELHSLGLLHAPAVDRAQLVAGIVQRFAAEVDRINADRRAVVR